MKNMFKNPWAKGGEFYPEELLKPAVAVLNNSNLESWIGGEVTNESDVPWVVSGISNSNPNHFAWLPKGRNSDNYEPVRKVVDGDVDAIWPLGQKIRLGSKSGKLVTSGAIKIRDHRNANIYGNANDGYYIQDYSVYYDSKSLPSEWKEPSRNEIK